MLDAFIELGVTQRHVTAAGNVPETFRRVQNNLYTTVLGSIYLLIDLSIYLCIF